MRRPTIADLARAAGVSVATVDRVLNRRHPVREATSRRVYEAANDLGYHAAGLIAQRLAEHRPHYRLGFLLQRPNQLFYQAFVREIEAAAQQQPACRVTPVIAFSDNQTPAEVAARLDAVAARSQAVAMVAVDHPTIVAAVQRWQDRGVPIFSLLSDFSGARQGYVGVDNRMAGRTAGWFIARMARPGKVAVFVGSHRFHGHELREIGLRSYFRENAPAFDILDTLVNLEDLGLAHEATLDLLQRQPDLAGVYIAGGGTEGVLAALREEGMAGRLVVVGNELTPATRAALADGLLTVALATPLQRLSRELMALMAAAVADPATAAAGQTFLPFEIYTAENI